METGKYIEQRKKLVAELRALLGRRTQMNRDIRKVRTEMSGWDTALIEGE